jgi:cellulose synthase/poly-beta-1,6-N-acetylglucosamine synthase-like glycosyltransferase
MADVEKFAEHGAALVSDRARSLDAESLASAGSAAQLEALAGHPINAFCVTLYNEDCTSLKKTLISILENCRSEHARDAVSPVVCIIVDGIDELDRAVLAMLGDAGMLRRDSTIHCADRYTEAELHFSAHRITALLSKLGYATNDDCPPSLVRTIVFLKQRNAGKLHSHHVFFNFICRRIEPRCCYQVDTGTELGPELLRHLTQRLDSDPDVAAIAPRITTAIPSLNDDFLATWQYADFAYQKSLSWPLEVSTGHLSVIPGQVCVFRWRALSGEDDSPGGNDPLNAYLRGLQVTGALERNMFLAEDRVIANEIALAPDGSWKLDYVPRATAITDPCRTLQELLRQRRRWNNGAMACRLWLFRQWPSLLKGAGERRNRRSFTAAMCTQAFLAAREFFIVTQFVALAWFLLEPLLNGPQTRGYGVYWAFWIAFAIELPLSFVNTSRLPAPAGNTLRSLRNVIGWVSAALFIAILTLMPLIAAAVLLLPALGLAAIAMLLPPRSLPTMIRAQFTPLPHLLMPCVLACYAICNLHDVSWGTKGLTESATAETSARQLRRWRNLIVTCWIVLNAALIYAVVHSHGWISPALNPMVEFVCLTEGVTALLSIGFMLQHRNRRRAAPRSEPAESLLDEA